MQPASHREEPAAQPTWLQRLHRWLFPPMRPYSELCAGLAPRTLGMLPQQSHVRRACIYAVKSRLFERLSLTLILANCVFLAMDSNAPDFSRTHIGFVLGLAEWFFLVAFTIEMVLKILALGFISTPGSYLRDPWNVIDCIVVVMGWVSLHPKVSNVSAMRTVRVLRPLRTITGIEGMRMLVATLLSSLPMLFDVLILCAFLFLIFGVIGLQTFMGKLRQECGMPVSDDYDGEIMTNVTQFQHLPGAHICGDAILELPPEGAWFAPNGAHPSQQQVSSRCCVLAIDSCQGAWQTMFCNVEMLLSCNHLCASSSEERMLRRHFFSSCQGQQRPTLRFPAKQRLWHILLQRRLA